jgi:hypothetical protein
MYGTITPNASRNISLTDKKYIFTFSFHCKQTFFGKIEGYPIWIWRQNLIFLKTYTQHRNV